MTLQGMRVRESEWLTVSGDPVQVRYSWRRRLLSWPWRPWVATYTMIPQVPDPDVYRFGNELVMHPQTLRTLMASLPRGRA